MQSHDEPVRLIVLRGVDGKREFLVREDVARLGRPEPGWSPEIAVIAPGVLAHHATLRREGENYHLVPEPGARVLVNRKEFTGGMLRDGDQLTFGGALFQYWTGGLKGRAPISEGTSDVSAPASATRGPAAKRRLVVGLILLCGGLLLLLVLRSVSPGPRP